jgi:hypothetical protein
MQPPIWSESVTSAWKMCRTLTDHRRGNVAAVGVEDAASPADTIAWRCTTAIRSMRTSVERTSSSRRCRAQRAIRVSFCLLIRGAMGGEHEAPPRRPSGRWGTPLLAWPLLEVSRSAGVSLSLTTPIATDADHYGDQKADQTTRRQTNGKLQR